MLEGHIPIVYRELISVWVTLHTLYIMIYNLKIFEKGYNFIEQFNIKFDMILHVIIQKYCKSKKFFSRWFLKRKYALLKIFVTLDIILVTEETIFYPWFISLAGSLQSQAHPGGSSRPHFYVTDATCFFPERFLSRRTDC